MDKFSNRLKELRERKGLTQQRLSELLGNIAVPTIKQWESEKRFPQMDSIITLSQFFNVTSDYLLGLTDVYSTLHDKYTYSVEQFKISMKEKGISNKALSEELQISPEHLCRVLNGKVALERTLGIAINTVIEGW